MAVLPWRQANRMHVCLFFILFCYLGQFVAVLVVVVFVCMFVFLGPSLSTQDNTPREKERQQTAVAIFACQLFFAMECALCCETKWRFSVWRETDCHNAPFPKARHRKNSKEDYSRRCLSKLKDHSAGRRWRKKQRTRRETVACGSFSKAWRTSEEIHSKRREREKFSKLYILVQTLVALK